MRQPELWEIIFAICIALVGLSYFAYGFLYRTLRKYKNIDSLGWFGFSIFSIALLVALFIALVRPSVP